MSSACATSAAEQLEHLAQHQRRALPRGQQLQRRDQGQPQTRPLLGGVRGVAEPRVRERLQPGHVETGHQRHLRVVAGRAQPARQRPAGPPLPAR